MVFSGIYFQNILKFNSKILQNANEQINYVYLWPMLLNFLAYFIQRTGLTDWTRGLDSRQCADEKSDCKIQVIMMTVINGLARQD